MELSKLCKWAEKNSRFSILLGLFIAFFGTLFSIDKSITIYNLNHSLEDKEQKINYLQSEIDSLNMQVNQISEDYKRSSKTWNSEKRKLLEGIVESKSESKPK